MQPALRHQQPPSTQWFNELQTISLYIWLHIMTDLWNKIAIHLTKWRRIPKLMILNPASNSNEKLWEKKKYHVFYSTMMMITTMGKVGLVASSSSLTDKNNTTRQLCRRHLFSSLSMSWRPDLLMLLSTIAMISLMFNQAGVTGIIS